MNTVSTIVILSFLLVSSLTWAGTVAPTTGPFLLHDLREYDPSVGILCTATTDAVPPIPPPTTVLATQFNVPASVFSCNNLTIDVGLSRRVGGTTQAVQYATAWIWSSANALATGNMTTSATYLVWSGNFTLPAALTEHRASGVYQETVRFQTGILPRNLVAGASNWFGLAIGVPRAYQSTTATYNEIRWMPVRGDIVSDARINTIPIYRAIDPYGNSVSVQHKGFDSWTSGDTATSWISKPLVPRGQSTTYRLATMIVGTCSSRLDASDPRHLTSVPPPYIPQELIPTPSPSPTPTEAPEPSPAPSPSPLLSPSPSPLPIPIVAVPPSPLFFPSPSPFPIPIPIPISTPAESVPSPSAGSPTLTIVPEPLPSSSPTPSQPVNHDNNTNTNNNNNNTNSSQWMSVVISSIVIGSICLISICTFLFVWSWCYAKRLGGYVIPSFSGSSINDEIAFNDVYQTGFRDANSEGSEQSAPVDLDPENNDNDDDDDELDLKPPERNDMVTVPLSSVSSGPKQGGGESII